MIAHLSYRPGLGEHFPPPATIFELRSDGLLTVSNDWRYGKGELRQYMLPQDDLEQLVDNLSRALDRVGEREISMDFGKDNAHHIVAIRVPGCRSFLMASSVDLKAPGARHESSGDVVVAMRDRLLWHELKDILQQAVIAVALKEAHSTPSTQPAH